ncbi:CheY chemotaxis protein or a CheY-like REC (receiver) domain [Marinobacter daqiaonensis]|uniref:CheY chemotaxis protein or a CheY-like REC (Receiver) domain n=1 Tax=Marinobacter daqiaonensis TaxID=650891 RepID=A0A1I6HFN2_9GAMM|nr:response regulator [Marinobacter daqiaonensis]SFR53303.1 CheY chemotaxis protein or a CheY-like REC (receiver) domain [Marinobacter daqiaonensis]
MRMIRKKPEIQESESSLPNGVPRSASGRSLLRRLPWVRGARGFRLISYSLVAIAVMVPAFVWNSLSLPLESWSEPALDIQVPVVMIGGILILEVALVAWVKMLQFGNERVRLRAGVRTGAEIPPVESAPDRTPVAGAGVGYPEQPPGRRPRVLVVDDDPINRMILRKQLLRLDVDSVSAADGTEALETVRHGEWDLVLMDGQMPRLDGPEASLEIRIRRLLPATVPIIAISTDDTPQFRERCLKAGMQACYHKPVRRFVVEKLVDVYIRHSVAEEPVPILLRTLGEDVRQHG